MCLCLWLKESVSRIWRQARRWAVFGGSSNQWEAYVSLSNTADRWVRGEQPKRSHLLLCRSSDRQLVAEVWSTLGSRPETGEEAHQESSTALQPLRCTITPPCLALSPQVSFFHIISDIFTPFTPRRCRALRLPARWRRDNAGVKTNSEDFPLWSGVWVFFWCRWIHAQ